MRRPTSPEDQALEELHRLRHPGEPTPPQEKRAPWARYIAIVLLAVICIGGAELAACRFFEPALYEDIMEPVRKQARRAVQIADRALESVCRSALALAEQAGASAAEARDSFQAWMEEHAAPPAEPLEEDTDSALSEPEVAPPKDILDPLISDIIQRGRQEILTGGGLDIVYFNQTDEAREEQMYGTDPLRTHGCGPTAMAMAVSSLTDKIVDPDDMAVLCVKQGYWCKHHGSYLSIVQGVAEACGLQCESLDPDTLDEGALSLRLATGDVAVALMTKGHFTKGGHFILLRGVTLGGDILVADPASRDRSLIPWDLSLILDELSPSRHNGAPLWILSKPAE